GDPSLRSASRNVLDRGDPSLRSGFRHAAQTPRKPQVRVQPPPPIFSERLRRRRSFAALRISPAGSRSAHARKPAQVRVQPPPPNFTLDPSLRSGFRLRAPAPLTPANRLKFESNRRHQISRQVLRCARLHATSWMEEILRC